MNSILKLYWRRWIFKLLATGLSNATYKEYNLIFPFQSHWPVQNQAPIASVVCFHWSPVLQNCVKVPHDLRRWGERGKEKKSCLIIWSLSVTDAVILYCTSVWVNGWEPTTISVKGNLWKMDILPQMNSGSLTGNLSIALNSLFEVKSDSLLVLMHLRSWERCEICKQSEVLTDYPTVH